MKRLATISLVIAALCVTATAQVRRPVTEGDENGIYSRTINHPDGSRTVSKQDINQKIREKQTLDKNGTLLMKSIFQLNTKGAPVNGLVYDGRSRLLYRSEFAYDGVGELQEERVFAASGELMRRLIYKKDRFGKSKPFALSFDDGRGDQGGNTSETRRYTAEELERYSTNSSHAYNGGRSASGVASTPSAYQGNTRPTPSSSSSSRTKKRDRRFRIFKRDR